MARIPETAGGKIGGLLPLLTYCDAIDIAR